MRGRIFDVKRVLVIILIACLVSTVIRPVTAGAAVFSDIDGHWAEKQILRVAASGVINGYKGQFNPRGNVTRAQFTILIVNALGLENEAAAMKGVATGYKDLSPNHYAAGHVMVAREKGLISGYPEGTFRPERQIRRDEITSILMRALKLDMGGSVEEALSSFTDAEEIPQWARTSVGKAVTFGFLKGFPDGSFKPSRPASRGETAALINSLLQELNRSFTFSGIVVRISTSINEIVLNVSGQEESFRYTGETPFYFEGTKIMPADLKAGDGAAIILDVQGRLKYVEKVELGQRVDGLVQSAVSAESAVKASGIENLSVLKTLSLGLRNEGRAKDVLILTAEGKGEQVRRDIEGVGGKIKIYHPEINYLVASVKEALIPALALLPEIESINIDKKQKHLFSAQDAEAFYAADGAGKVGKDPQKSLAVTKDNISADVFSELKQVTGEGQVIAIIDTGIDPGHPDLQSTPGGERKIVVWKDFTGEGIIDTKAMARKANQTLTLADGNYLAGSIVSISDTYHYGYLREADFSIEDQEGLDLNFNGEKTDVFAVLVIDSKVKGQFDTVYVDTDMDKDFTDEQVLELYEKKPVFSSFESTDGKNIFNFNLLEMNADGTDVHLGFDGNDHGTHVAGIAAANGYAKGIAPAAQVMALKVLDSAGYGSWTAVSQAMIYAATNGAKVINLSLGFQPDDFVGGSVPAKLINSLTEEYGILIVAAAGNEGPGLSSLATPADADRALSVGAYTSPEMWQTDYGWEVAKDSLWFFSAIGPRGDGAMVPNVVAPGSAVSTVPMRKGEHYFLSEGTSMAAPHVSGSVALLLEAADISGFSVTPAIIKAAFKRGAERLPEYSYIEQGYGKVDVYRTWLEMQLIDGKSAYLSSVYNSRIETGPGIFEKRYVPQNMSWYLRNDNEENKELAVSTHSKWVSEDVQSVLIPSGQTREIPLELKIPDKPGLYSALVRADDHRTYGVDVDLPITVVKPYEFSGSSNYSVAMEDSLSAAQYKRYFLKVEPGTTDLNIALTPQMDGDKARGKVRMYLYSPDGTKEVETLFAGGDGSGQVSVSGSVEKPMAGTWEVIVYSSASLSELELTRSNFTLTASVSPGSNNLPLQEREVIISMVPKDAPEDRDSYTTIQIRNRDNKKPFQGAIEINGRLYYTRKGYITLPVKANSSGGILKVTTLTDINKYKPLEYNFRVD